VQAQDAVLPVETSMEVMPEPLQEAPAVVPPPVAGVFTLANLQQDQMIIDLDDSEEVRSIAALLQDS
jgi:hypothetical protein